MASKLGIVDYSALQQADEAQLDCSQRLQKKLCSLLVSFRIQEYLTHIIVSNK